MHEGPKVITEQPDTTSIIILFDRAPGQGPKALTEHPARTSQFHESTEELYGQILIFDKGGKKVAFKIGKSLTPTSRQSTHPQLFGSNIAAATQD
ncbi:hypothetical protein E4U44_000585 [Claviceps purpurea]|nr:hypothetical protein E4U44_000585 [Claviceps purpurea]